MATADGTALLTPGGPSSLSQSYMPVLCLQRRDGEDLEAQDPSDGCRPLHAAVLAEQTEAASYLLRRLEKRRAPI